MWVVFAKRFLEAREEVKNNETTRKNPCEKTCEKTVKKKLWKLYIPWFEASWEDKIWCYSEHRNVLNLKAR